MPVRVYENLASINALSEEEAVELFVRCSGSRAWAAAMMDLRPFRTLEHLFTTAEEVWFRLSTVEQLEAYAATQLPLVHLSADLLTAYQERFGFRFVAGSTGRGPDELDAILRARLRNSPETELRIASEEHCRDVEAALEAVLEQ